MRMDDDMRHVELLVGQLFGGHADIVLSETHFQDGADVAAGQTAKSKETTKGEFIFGIPFGLLFLPSHAVYLTAGA